MSCNVLCSDSTTIYSSQFISFLFPCVTYEFTFIKIYNIVIIFSLHYPFIAPYPFLLNYYFWIIAVACITCIRCYWSTGNIPWLHNWKKMAPLFQANIHWEGRGLLISFPWSKVIRSNLVIFLSIYRYVSCIIHNKIFSVLKLYEQDSVYLQISQKFRSWIITNAWWTPYLFEAMSPHFLKCYVTN